MVEVLKATCEVDFHGFSDGFQLGRSQHQALDALSVAIMSKMVNWVLDAETRGFFGAMLDRVAKGADTKIIRCPIRAPQINSVGERSVGSARRECLEHIVVLDETHRRSVLVA